MVRLAREANRCILDNGNEPTPPNMSEMDVAEAEGFLDEVLLCLPILGVNVFAKPEKAQRKQERFYLRGADAGSGLNNQQMGLEC